MGRLAPKPGDTCKSCADHWTNQGLPPKKLVRIGTTQNKKLMVPICPYCDGELVITIPNKVEE